MGIFYGAQNYKFTTRYEIAHEFHRLKILLKLVISRNYAYCNTEKGAYFYDKSCFSGAYRVFIMFSYSRLWAFVNNYFNL